MSAGAVPLPVVEPKVDARPIMPVSADSVWDQALRRRDYLATVIEGALEEAGWKALLLKSQNGHFPAWLRLEAWIPDATRPGVHRRAEFDLAIEARALHDHKLTYTARSKRGKKSIALEDTTTFSDQDAVEWALHTIIGGPRPKRYRPVLSAARGLIGALIPPLHPRHNPVAADFRSRVFDLPFVLVLIACALVAAAYFREAWLGSLALTLAALVFVGTLALALFEGRYRVHDSVVARPREAPRLLHHVDSWSAVLSGVGPDAAGAMQRIAERLVATAGTEAAVRSERFGHRTARGYEERERLIVTRAQGHVQIHVHAIGSDLFFGWQAHINWAQWTETPPVSRRETGSHRVSFRDIRPGWYQPSEFDLMDLDALGALVHTTMEREARTLLQRCGSDQKVDFEVDRGDRVSALEARKRRSERSSGARRWVTGILGLQVHSSEVGAMPPAQLSLEPTRARGMAVFPAFVVLPVLMSLGYWLVYATEAVWLFRLEIPIAESDVPFHFLPIYLLPFAAAVAIGLWLYGGVRVAHAVAVTLLIELFAFALSYTNLLVYGLFFAEGSARRAGVAFTTAWAALASVGTLLAAAIWAPTLRSPRRWAVALLLWTSWATVATLLVRELRPSGAILTVAALSTRLLMGATFGYWLWRDNAMPKPRRDSVATKRAAARQADYVAASDNRARKPVTVEGNDLAAGALFVALGAVAFLFARELAMDSGDRLGPSSMPTVFAALLVVFGIATALESDARRLLADHAAYMAMIVVLGSAALFALTARPLGLVAAVALASAWVSWYSLRGRPVAILAAVATSVVGAVAIVTAVSASVALWPSI